MRILHTGLLKVDAYWDEGDLVLMHVDDRGGVHSGLYRIIVPRASRARLAVALGCDEDDDSILGALRDADPMLFSSGVRTWLARRYIDTRLEL